MFERKPYLIDWRILPDGMLSCKDELRHHINRLGGDTRHASSIGRAWFAYVRFGTLNAMVRAGVMFIHVPRTGGSAVARALYGRNLPHLTIGYYRSLGNRRLAGLPSFAIVREPVDRLASAYRFLVAGGTAVVASSRYDPRGLAQSPSFDAFVETIAFDPAALHIYDPIRPQADFVTDEHGSVLVDRLFRFDDLATGDAALAEWIGVPRLARFNESRSAPAVCSPSTRRLIETLYAEDFALYERLCTDDRSIPAVCVAKSAA